MTTDEKGNTASIRQRLLNIARTSGENFQQLLTRYANERFLYRLSNSQHKDKFLLKGASLFTLWFGVPHRQTRDIDFLGFGSNEIEELKIIVKDVIQIECEDGLTFDEESIEGGEIKEGEEYQGVRITFLAKLGNAKIYLQTDVGFGDPVNPGPQAIDFPTLLDLPRPKLNVYPKETVVAEKLEAMVKLGIANSRMKDFWDVNLMIREFGFEGKLLQNAIIATFAWRKTVLPTVLPLAFRDEFANDAAKQMQWKAFLKRNGFPGEQKLDKVLANLRHFFNPILEASVKGYSFTGRWEQCTWVY